jgi:hypothetical protein
LALFVVLLLLTWRCLEDNTQPRPTRRSARASDHAGRLTHLARLAARWALRPQQLKGQVFRLSKIRRFARQVGSLRAVNPPFHGRPSDGLLDSRCFPRAAPPVDKVLFPRGLERPTRLGSSSFPSRRAAQSTEFPGTVKRIPQNFFRYLAQVLQVPGPGQEAVV